MSEVDERRQALKEFYKNPAWGRLVDHMSDDKVETKLKQLTRNRKIRSEYGIG